MSCSAENIDFVCSQIEGVGVINARPMFGEYGIYVDGKMVLLVCDDICYVRMHPAIEELMKDAETGAPYPGAKQHYILDVSHGTQAREIVRILRDVLPYPREKKKRKTDDSVSR